SRITLATTTIQTDRTNSTAKCSRIGTSSRTTKWIGVVHPFKLATQTEVSETRERTTAPDFFVIFDAAERFLKFAYVIAGIATEDVEVKFIYLCTVFTSNLKIPFAVFAASISWIARSTNKWIQYRITFVSITRH